MGHVTIFRAANLRNEQRVRVLYGGREYSTDPYIEVKNALDVNLGRDYSIVSFAYGIKSAGHQVSMVHPRACCCGLCHRDDTFRAPQRFSPEYFLYGLAWVRGEWSSLSLALKTKVTYTYRASVLRETGFYYERQYGAIGPLRLQISLLSFGRKFVLFLQ